MNERVVVKVFGLDLLGVRAFGDVQNRFHFIPRHQRHPRKDAAVFVVDAVEGLAVVGLEKFPQGFERAFFVAPDHRDRFGIGAQKPQDRLRLLLDRFSRGRDRDEDKRDVEFGDVENGLEPQFAGLKNRRHRHEPGGGVARLEQAEQRRHAAGVGDLDVLIRDQSEAAQHDAGGVVGGSGGLGRRHDFALEVAHRFDRRIAVELKNKSRHGAGDIDRIGAFQRQIHRLIADQADFLAAGGERLRPGGRRHVSQIMLQPVLGQQAHFMGHPHRGHRAAERVVDHPQGERVRGRRVARFKKLSGENNRRAEERPGEDCPNHLSRLRRWTMARQ